MRVCVTLNIDVCTWTYSVWIGKAGMYVRVINVPMLWVFMGCLRCMHACVCVCYMYIMRQSCTVSVCPCTHSCELTDGKITGGFSMFEPLEVREVNSRQHLSLTFEP